MMLRQMPRTDYRRCRVCERSTEQVGPLSHTRLCVECGDRIEQEAAWQIHYKQGPYAELRRYGIIKRELGPRVALALKQAGMLG